jgi:hypothetical protein
LDRKRKPAGQVGRENPKEQVWWLTLCKWLLSTHQNQDESPQNGYLRGEEVLKIGSQEPGKEIRTVSKNQSVSAPKLKWLTRKG